MTAHSAPEPSGKPGQAHTPSYRYPYDAADGREDVNADSSIRRVVRGGSYHYSTKCGNSFVRNWLLPAERHPGGTFRIASVRIPS